MNTPNTTEGTMEERIKAISSLFIYDKIEYENCLKFIRQELLAQLEHHLKLIGDEIATAHKEGQPTSRLTSLYMKLEEEKTR